MSLSMSLNGLNEEVQGLEPTSTGRVFQQGTFTHNCTGTTHPNITEILLTGMLLSPNPTNQIIYKTIFNLA